MKITLFFHIIFVIFMSFGAWGQQEAGSLVTAEELQIQQRARKKLYPGGKDEENLKVQAQLIQPVRKMSPQTEAPEESQDSAGEHD